MTPIANLLHKPEPKKRRAVSSCERTARLTIIRHLLIEDYVLSGNAARIPAVEILAKVIETVDKMAVPTYRLRRLFQDAREAKQERFRSQGPLTAQDISYIADRCMSRDICEREMLQLRYAFPDKADTALRALPEVKEFETQVLRQRLAIAQQMQKTINSGEVNFK